ncbi:MAG: hypothetical protein MRJ65_17425 [Candidatus Brocadiaceae bacterium]|nr:hypothetical protein [Candidatus Brocadiaceae bacterium]
MICSRGMDILLWNSFMGKAYSVSDCFKENGIGLLVRACKDAGFSMTVEDPARIDFYSSFTKNELEPELSRLSAHVFGKKNGEDSASLRKEWDSLQENLSCAIKGKMEEYLNSLAKKVRDEQVKVLGIKTWLGDRFTYSEELTRKVNQLSPNTIVIAGGPQVNQFKIHALEESPFDFCIDVEGETTLTKIVAMVKEMYGRGCKKVEVINRITELAKTGELQNLIYRDADNTIRESTIRRLPLNKKTFPLYEKEDGKADIAVINESSGCYYGKCGFCSHPNITGKYQTRDVDITLQEIKENIQKYSIGLFRFAGSVTPASLGRKIANAIVKEGLHIEYSMFVRAENRAKARITELINTYEEMIRSGLRAVFMGVEAVDKKLLSESMQKGSSIADMYYTIKALKQASYNQGMPVDVGVSFIYPCPIPSNTGTTHEKVLEKNLCFLRSLKIENFMPDSVLITPGVPLPLTAWQLKPKQFGFDLPEDYVQKIIRYEYELTKDPSVWPDLDITSNGIRFKDMLKMSGQMEKKVRKMGYTVNVSDEHCLAARSSGFVGQKGLEEFKLKSDMALLTTDYRFLREVYNKINSYSRALAEKNNS